MFNDKTRLLIVQPWFTAIGHPAQSTLNTANALGVNERVEYLVSTEDGEHNFAAIQRQLEKLGRVNTFRVPGPSIRWGTLLSLFTLLRIGRHGKYRQILFLDAHLVLLAFFWKWLAWLVKPEQLSVIYLKGPEKIAGHPLARLVVHLFLSRPETRLFLRTDELVSAWRAAFPCQPENKIDVLPSLELFDNKSVNFTPTRSKILKFGVLGQVRPGKGIEWLVPFFVANPSAGELTVAGACSTLEHQHELDVLKRFDNFINRFFSGQELLEIAQRQDYLLLLYDNWDARMEAAMLYLAANANRPVIVRESGWCGRMVNTYKCGVTCKQGEESADFFMALPRPESAAYQALLFGLEQFRNSYSGPVWRQQFIEKVIGS